MPAKALSLGHSLFQRLPLGEKVPEGSCVNCDDGIRPSNVPAASFIMTVDIYQSFKMKFVYIFFILRKTVPLEVFESSRC